MSFASEIYPYRSNRSAFVGKLLAKVDREFQSVEWVEIAGRVSTSQAKPAHTLRTVNLPEVGKHYVWYPGRRCRFRFVGCGSQEVCDFSAKLDDKKVVKAILRAWARQISDRFLDYREVSRLAKMRRFGSVQQAFDHIRRNAPAGAVRFIRNEIEKWDPPLFGTNMPEYRSYSEYYSHILNFDLECCGGLILELHRLSDLSSEGGGSVESPVWNAAAKWIKDNRHNGIYRELRS